MPYRYILLALVALMYSRYIIYFANAHIKYKEKRRGSEYERGYTDGVALMGSEYRLKIYRLVYVISVLSYFWYYDSYITAVIYSILTYMLFVVVEVDVQVRIISNESVLAFLVLGIFYRVLESVYSLNGYEGGLLYSLGDAFSGMLFIFVLFMLSGFVTRKLTGRTGVGAGDIKFMSVLAIFPGYSRLVYLIVNFLIFLSFFATWGVRSGVLRRGGTFPFGVQLSGGFLMYLMYVPAMAMLGM